MALSLGIDIGGTFTDIVLHDPVTGRATIFKESTTPDDPARGALIGAREVLKRAGRAPGEVGRVVHATTLFTNALIERKGIGRVACPPGAGAGSTFGMLMAPARVDRVAHHAAPLARADTEEILAILATLEAEGRAVLAATGAEMVALSAIRQADMRYVGQGSELTVPLPEVLTPEALRTQFEAAYRRLFARTPGDQK